MSLLLPQECLSRSQSPWVKLIMPDLIFPIVPTRELDTVHVSLGMRGVGVSVPVCVFQLNFGTQCLSESQKIRVSNQGL